jgi:hypothetical protein
MENAALNPPATMQSKLQSKLAKHSARIGIVGMGYVGLPLALRFSEQRFPVTGFEYCVLLDRWTRTRHTITWDCDRRNSISFAAVRNHPEETMAAGTAAKRVSPELRAELLQDVLSVRAEYHFLAALRALRAFLYRVPLFFAFVVHGFLAE